MELRTEVEIPAPPERVWEVLTDFGSYPRWNPFIGRIDGKLAVGQKLRLAVSPSAGRQMTLKARVTVLSPGQELAWTVSHMPLPGLLEGTHFFKLTPTERGTRLVHGENFSGLMVKSNGNALTGIARAFVAMNQALGREVERAGGSQ